MKKSPRPPNINIDFIGEMIPHHEGAILMCKNVLTYPIDPRLRGVALTIIQEQNRGIQELETMKSNLYQKSLI